MIHFAEGREELDLSQGPTKRKASIRDEVYDENDTLRDKITKIMNRHGVQPDHYEGYDLMRERILNAFSEELQRRILP